jgi:Holliday junction resolvasome RuvABC endonuclease subunit
MTTIDSVSYTIAPPVVSSAVTLLGLDASSTAIGWVIYDGRVVDHGEVLLKSDDIAERCRLAYAGLGLILSNYPYVDAIAIESPVAAFAKALIPQARVSGALMACAALSGLLVCEMTPMQAKRALAGEGNATKLAMRANAAEYMVYGEHAADALGVVLAAYGRVKRV